MEMKSDLKDLKTDIRLNNKQIDLNNKKINNVNIKIDAMKNQMKINEEETDRKFEDIRKEIKETNEALEKNVTESVIETVKPRIREIEVSSKIDLRKIIQEELALQNSEEA